MKYIPLIAFAALCIMLAFAVMRPKESPPASALVGKPFPSLTLENKEITTLLSRRVMMVNLFASWCAPCAVEQPMLMKIHKQNILPILGIAWKNKPHDVAIWLAKYGNPYTHLLFDAQGTSTLPLAMTGIPETFIVDKKGMIAYHTRTPITDKMLAEEIIPLVERLEAE